MKNLNEILANLNDEQKQLLADTIKYGSWGDCQEYFGDECVYVDGYITDEAYKGNHFVRKELSNRFKSLFKALGLEGTKYSKKNDTMVWHYDWWGDGSGSILLIREELSGEFEKWAKEYNK